MNPRYQTVLLDADNTLFDFTRAEDLAVDWLLSSLSLPPEEKPRYLRINRAMWKKGDLGEITQEALVVERFRLFLEETGVNADPAEVNRAYLAKVAECSALLPGAMELCRDLAKVCRLAIVTNGVTMVQKKRLAESGLSPYISGLYISQEMGWRKPQRQLFEAVFAKMGLHEGDKPRTVMVGDNLLSDIRGGQNFGLDTIWLAPEGAETNGAEVVPTYTAHALPDVKRLVLGHETQH